MKIYVIKHINRSGACGDAINDSDFYLKKETAIKRLKEYFNEKTEYYSKDPYLELQWKNETKFIITSDIDHNIIYHIF